MKQQFLKKLEEHTINAGVFGLGYVGLPLATEIAKAGIKSLGIDVSEGKVEQVKQGKNYIGDIDDQTFSKLVSENMLDATTDFAKVADLDFIAICVPSPLDEHGQPDMSYIESASEAIGKYLTKGTLVVLESTTYPGTTEEIVKPILENGSGLVCGEDFWLGFSPERVDPGNAKYKTNNTPKIVGGVDQTSCELMKAIYSSFLSSEIHMVSSPAVAEMEKILENTYRNINIGLINEIAILCNVMGINVWEVIEAAATKPYGFQAFYPGPGLGGHCIPLDPSYLSYKAREYMFHTSMIECSMMINDRMPSYCIERASKILNEVEKPLKNSRILVMGVAYKQDINDYRESASLKVIDLFEKSGSKVDYYDPFIPSYRYNGYVREGIESISPEIIREYDLVVITTGHTCIDYDMVQQNAAFIFDTKNVMKNVENRNNIEVL